MLSDGMLEKFTHCYLGDMVFDSFGVSSNDIADWLRGQDISNMDLIVPELGILMSNLTSYQFPIKRNPKPVLTADAEN